MKRMLTRLGLATLLAAGLTMILPETSQAAQPLRTRQRTQSSTCTRSAQCTNTAQCPNSGIRQRQRDGSGGGQQQAKNQRRGGRQ